MKEWLDCYMNVCLSHKYRQWYWTWKALLSIKNYFYQHQNITIIIKGQSKTCPISEIAIIILSPTSSLSFQAAAFSFTNLFFPSSRFRLLSSVRSLCCLPHLAPTALRKKKTKKNKKTEQRKKILSALSAMRNTQVWFKITRVNFTRRRTEVNFPSADWLSYLN